MAIFSDKDFQGYSFAWKKDLLKCFWIFLFNKLKVWWILSPKKIPCPPKNPWLRACSWFLSNMFCLLNNHLTNIALSFTLSVFCLCKDSTITSKQLSAKRCSNVIVLLCTAETERAQSLMRTLARTNFKSI